MRSRSDVSALGEVAVTPNCVFSTGALPTDRRNSPVQIAGLGCGQILCSGAIEQMAFPMPQPVSDVAQACSPRTQDFLTVVGR